MQYFYLEAFILAWENSLWRQYWFSRKMMSEKQVQKFYTDDSSLPRSG